MSSEKEEDKASEALSLVVVGELVSAGGVKRTGDGKAVSSFEPTDVSWGRSGFRRSVKNGCDLIASIPLPLAGSPPSRAKGSTTCTRQAVRLVFFQQKIPHSNTHQQLFDEIPRVLRKAGREIVLEVDDLLKHEILSPGLERWSTCEELV